MLKNLFKKKPTVDLIDNHQEADVVLRLMFEIAISDGNLDKAELKIIKDRASLISGEDTKVSTVIRKIIDGAQESVSFYPFVLNISYILWRQPDSNRQLLACKANGLPIDDMPP